MSKHHIPLDVVTIIDVRELCMERWIDRDTSCLIRILALLRAKNLDGIPFMFYP